MGGRGIAATALVVLGATLLAPPASAEPEPIRLEYSAPRRCPDEAAFLRALRQRTTSFQLARAADAARVFVATIAVDGGAVTGRLEIRGPGAEASLRKVPGKTCDEVMEALALMTALAVDPGALAASPPAASAAPPTSPAPPARPARPATQPPPPPSSPAAVASPSSAAAAAASAVPPAQEGGPEPRPAPTAAARALSAPVEPTTGNWRWSMGAHGAASSGISPSLGLGGVLFVDAAAPGSSPWAPVLRAGLAFSQSDVGRPSGTMADFRWLTGVAEGCPARLVTADARLGLFPCLAVQVGGLRGRGSQLDEPRSTTTLWADIGPLLRLRLAVSARLFLEAQGALVVPLRRVSFDVQESGPGAPATTLFAVPALGARAGFGVAYGFE